jgi:hypothetical protein
MDGHGRAVHRVSSLTERERERESLRRETRCESSLLRTVCVREEGCLTFAKPCSALAFAPASNSFFITSVWPMLAAIMRAEAPLLPTASTSAPSSSSTSTTAPWPIMDAVINGVMPSFFSSFTSVIAVLLDSCAFTASTFPLAAAVCSAEPPLLREGTMPKSSKKRALSTLPLWVRWKWYHASSSDSGACGLSCSFAGTMPASFLPMTCPNGHHSDNAGAAWMHKDTTTPARRGYGAMEEWCAPVPILLSRWSRGCLGLPRPCRCSSPEWRSACQVPPLLAPRIASTQARPPGEEAPLRGQSRSYRATGYGRILDVLFFALYSARAGALHSKSNEWGSADERT